MKRKLNLALDSPAESQGRGVHRQQPPGGYGKLADWEADEDEEDSSGDLIDEANLQIDGGNFLAAPSQVTASKKTGGKPNLTLGIANDKT